MKYRNEWKYIVSNNDLTLIENKLSLVLKKDEHLKNGKYIIHSLYFDDLYNTAMKENDAGVSKRYKWRIRYYDDDLSYIVLERKEKYNGMCGKRSCRLNKDEFMAIMNNDYMDYFYKSDSKLFKMFCMDLLNRCYRPKIIIDYERTAYVEPISNVRITFDRNITSSKEVNEFLEGSYTRFPLQENSSQVLEVKFDDILPSYVKQAVQLDSLKQTSFSKYYLGRYIQERI